MKRLCEAETSGAIRDRVVVDGLRWRRVFLDTLRGLVQVIDASDGIVYVESGECGHGVRACLVGVTAAGEDRILWIKVDTGKEGWDLMGSIGHELRHAVEVLGNPKVTSNAAMYFFYETMRAGAGPPLKRMPRFRRALACARRSV